jgi:hypothetical protein
MRWIISNDTIFGGIEEDRDEISWNCKIVRDCFNTKEEI